MDRTGLILWNKLRRLNEKHRNDWFTLYPGVSCQEYWEKYNDRDIDYLKFLYECFLGNKVYPAEHWVDRIESYYDGWVIRNKKTNEVEFYLSILRHEMGNHSYAGYPVIRVIPSPYNFPNTYYGKPMKHGSDWDKKHGFLENFQVPTDFFYNNLSKLTPEEELKLRLIVDFDYVYEKSKK